MDKETILRWFRAHRRFWVAWGLLMLVNLAGYLLFVRNEAAEIGRLQDAYQRQRRQVAEEIRAQAENQRRVDSQEALKQFWNAVGPESHFPERLRQFKNLTESRRIDIGRLAFTPQNLDALGVTRFETQLTARGDYGELKGLLADIQALEGLFCVEAFSMTREKPGAPATMKAKVTIYLSAPPDGA